jgi:poly-gamma-glutamate synthesis protein (capsule biosynthesis protein)
MIPAPDADFAIRLVAKVSRRVTAILIVLPVLAALVSGSSDVWAEAQNSAVSVVFVGDIMLAGIPGELIKRGRDPFVPFGEILRSADFRIGNLECVIATAGMPINKIYTFRAHPRTLKVLKRHFTALSLANNHTGDFGTAAFGEMLDLLDQAGILYFGGGRNLSEAHAPIVLEHNGLRIALLGYDEFLPRSFEAGADRSGVAWSEDEQVRADIRRARTQFNADIVIPFMHWGWERESSPSQRQRQLARLMIDAGADAVVGGHPHVIQGFENYKDRPIFYSLGNFVFTGFNEEVNNTGWLLRLDLDKHGVQRWKTYVAEIDRYGVPHPSRKRKGYCYERGQVKEVSCGINP